MKAEIKKIPASPGVYFFKNAKDKILYIGKAINLRGRIRSYFDSRPKEPKITKMLETAGGVDWQKTDSEIEALILESQLIKKYRPPFNIMLRDDKQYFYVGFTKEKFPRLIITHRPSAEVISLLRPGDAISSSCRPCIPKARTISGSGTIGPFTDGTALKTTLKLLRRIFPYCTCKQKHYNYCLNYHIGNCLGFCCLKKEATAGQTTAYKKNVTAIKEVLSGKRKPLIRGFEKEMRSLAGKGNFEKAIELRDKTEKLRMVFENAKILRDANIRMHANDANKTLAETQEALKLNALPQRIEGYDVSNIQGGFATGAMAVFINGQPDKNEYRKFRVHTSGGDTAMLKEIVMRRFGHSEWQYPDLVLIDGGRAQLNAAKAAILNSKFSILKRISVVALAKDARHRGSYILVDTKRPAIPLKKLPAAVRNLILQIDAEAHRFAIGYYRKLHKKFFK